MGKIKSISKDSSSSNMPSCFFKKQSQSVDTVFTVAGAFRMAHRIWASVPVLQWTILTGHAENMQHAITAFIIKKSAVNVTKKIQEDTSFEDEQMNRAKRFFTA